MPTRHGLVVRSLAVALAGGRVLPSGTGIYVVDGAVGGLRRRIGHLGVADVFPWPDIVAVRPERVGESSVRLDWTRAPMAGILVDSGHCPVELVDRVEVLLPWWPLIAVITANRHLARSHPVFAGVTVIPAPRGRAGL